VFSALVTNVDEATAAYVCPVDSIRSAILESPDPLIGLSLHASAIGAAMNGAATVFRDTSEYPLPAAFHEAPYGLRRLFVNIGVSLRFLAYVGENMSAQAVARDVDCGLELHCDKQDEYREAESLLDDLFRRLHSPVESYLIARARLDSALAAESYPTLSPFSCELLDTDPATIEP
jgi:hypothetical protein